MLNQAIHTAMKPINEIEAKEYDRYASPDHTKARRAQAHGLVKMCQIIIVIIKIVYFQFLYISIKIRLCLQVLLQIFNA